jgi:hypothetical protein
MFRALHWFSSFLLVVLAVLASRTPLPATGLFAANAATSNSKSYAAVVSVDWYEPNEEDFKAAYQGDSANMAKQSWSEYWGWIKSFYAGNFLDSGWTKRCQGVLRNIPDERKRTELRAKLNAIGKSIAAEWAKVNTGRKVDNSKLLGWGTRLQEAMKRDDGAGAVIQKEIELIGEEVGN